MVTNTHTATASLPRELRSALYMTSNRSPGEEQATLRPTGSASTHAFVPRMPFLSPPFVSPIVALSSIPHHSGTSKSHPGSNTSKVPSDLYAEFLTSRGLYVTSTTTTHLSRTTVPPVWFATPPTPPHPMASKRSVTNANAFHHRLLSDVSTQSNPSSSHSSSVSIKAISHPLNHPPCSSSANNRLPLPLQVQAPYLSLKEQRARRRLSVKIPGCDDVVDAQPLPVISGDHKRLRKVESKIDSDGIRRYHALMELLRTEANYVCDLRILVTIYLQQLPMVTTTIRMSTTSYFGSSSTLNVATKAHPSNALSPFGVTPLPMNVVLALNTSAQLPIPTLPPVNAPVIARRRSKSVTFNHHEVEKNAMPQRRLFSYEDLALLSRNAKDLLDFHDRFVEDIQEAVTPFGPAFFFSVGNAENKLTPTKDTLERVIEIIMLKFIDQASAFSIYQSFCSTHTEACELIQKAKKQYPIEWAIWEKQCTSLVQNMPRIETADMVPFPATTVDNLDSTSPEPLTERSWQPRRPRSSPSLASSAVSENMHVASAAIYASSTGHRQSSKLVFSDYLIKPVQRICKYHLLLDQLKAKQPIRDAELKQERSHRHAGSQTDALVSQAVEAMRSVVDSVNDDRRRQEYHSKSLLIASRIAPNAPLSSGFLRSLGACLLAGALDVVYHRPSSSATSKAKYLGTFLYACGYLILTKVVKGKYDPHHWFALNGFEVFDKQEDDPVFPYSFHMIGQGHHFQFAAACQKEKEIWIEGLRESINSTTEWATEPISSLRDENKEEITSLGVVFPPGHETASEGTVPLPTIESVSESEDIVSISNPRNAIKVQQPGCPNTSSTHISSEVKPMPSLSKLDMMVKQDPSLAGLRPSSRLSSTVSVKAMFSPFLFDSGVRISRCSSLQRQHVEQGLADVLSDLCRDARALAEIHSVELFHMPKKMSPAISKSSITVRSKRDNKTQSRQSYAGATDRQPRKQKNLQDVSHRKGWSISTTAIGDGFVWAEDTHSSRLGILQDDSIDPHSVCSSGTSVGGSSRSSPIVSNPPTPIHMDERVTTTRCRSIAKEKSRPKRSQSMIAFRSFFTPRALSNASKVDSQMKPVSANSTRDLAEIVQDDIKPNSSPTSTRKRTQSTPVILFPQPLSSAGSVLNTPINSTVNSTDPPQLVNPVVEEKLREGSKTLHHKRSSFLRIYTRRDSANSADVSRVPPTRRKSLKDILHYFRSNSFTSIHST